MKVCYTCTEANIMLERHTLERDIEAGNVVIAIEITYDYRPASPGEPSIVEIRSVRSVCVTSPEGSVSYDKLGPIGKLVCDTLVEAHIDIEDLEYEACTIQL